MAELLQIVTPSFFNDYNVSSMSYSINTIGRSEGWERERRQIREG